MKMRLFLTVCGLISLSYADPVAAPREYCEGESFEAECHSDEDIMMSSALYGRMEVGGCITEGHGQVGCSLDVMSILDAKCSGRRQCSVRVSSVYDEIPEAARPCSSDLRSYLTARASCVKVIVSPKCTREEPMVLTADTGVLSSRVTKETDCGMKEKPWRIKVQKGKTILLILYDFLAGTRSFHGDVSRVCEVYATIRESQGQETVCGSHLRESTVYSSLTNEIEVRMYPKSSNDGDNQRYFLLKYKALGCGSLTAPSNGWIRQTSSWANFGCNYTDVTWSMTCTGNVWLGDNKTCPGPSVNPGASLSSNGLPETILTGSKWIAVLIIASIAVTLSLSIFLAGLLYIRRQRGSSNSPPQRNNPAANHLPPFYATRSPVPAHAAIPDYSGQSEAMKYMITPHTDGVNATAYPPNDYSRTWQMQRHNRGDVTEELTNQNTLPQQQLSQIDGRPITEHIYESPPFERKCNSLDSPRNKNTFNKDLFPKNVQYYELDPRKTGRKGAIL